MYDIPGSEGDSLRDRAIRSGNGDKVPDGEPPIYGMGLINVFWGCRKIAGDHDVPVSPIALKQWCEHLGRSISRVERDIIFAMDVVFRTEMPKAIRNWQEIENRNK